MKQTLIICILLLLTSMSLAENTEKDKGNSRGHSMTTGGCDYVVGDVNGSDNYNGLDITYGVSFLRNGAPVPQCADCPLCPGWHYCGDVNASCSYNGLDITYGVAYLRGGPGLQPCADCPPIG